MTEDIWLCYTDEGRKADKELKSVLILLSS